MIDKKLVDEVYRLMKDAGLKAFCIMGIDQDQNFLTLDGGREDLARMFTQALGDNDLHDIIHAAVKMHVIENILKGGER